MLRRQNKWYMKWARIVKLFVQGNAEFESDVSIAGGITNVETIQFDLTFADGTSEGQLYWVDGETLNLGMPGGNVNQSIGLELYAGRGKNVRGSPILNGTLVIVTGASGDNPEVVPADPDSIATAGTAGMATEDIADGQFGYITKSGLVHGDDTQPIDTSAYAAGALLWLDDDGGFTNIPPTAPRIKVIIGLVRRSHATQGVIDITIALVPRLRGLSDVHSPTTPNNKQIIAWNATNARWEIDVNASEKSWAFESKVGTTGIAYFGGFYEFFSGNDDFTVAANFGTANVAKAAHVLLVLGELTVDEVIIRVAGTGITDAGVRTGSDTEDIVIPDATAADSYFETAKKFNGQVTITLISGTAKQCNYGWAKYWDNSNTDFKVVGLEITWLGGANDPDPDIELIHHKATGWTYNAGSTPTNPTPIASHKTTQSPEHQVANGEPGAYKRTDLSTVIAGSASEGTLWAITNSVNRAFEEGNIIMRITPE